MKLNLFDKERRGQVGIGTLIVFIAMVLVAAIAAGVLINTAGFLQTQAEDTGTESTEQVADNLNVITEVGVVEDDGGAGDEIDKLRIGVQPAAGADDINLAELTLQYVSDDEFANLIVGVEDGTGDRATGDTSPSDIVVSSSADEDNYALDVITAENDDDVVMTDNADRYEIVVPLNDDPDFNSISTDADGNTTPSQIGDLAPLEEGDEVEITITTSVGAQTVAFLQVPDSLSGDEQGSTVNL